MDYRLSLTVRQVEDGQEKNMRNSLKVSQDFFKDFQNFSYFYYSAKFIWQRLEKSRKVHRYTLRSSN